MSRYFYLDFIIEFTIKAVYYANSIVSVPDVYYYYFQNPKSTVNTFAKAHRKKFNKDKNDARRDVVWFLKSKHAAVRDKDFWYVKSEQKFADLIPLFKVKISTKSERGYLFGFILLYNIKRGEN